MSAPLKLSKERLLNTTARLFAEYGYDGTSITDITEALGVTRPTLYTHAQSKQELIDAIFDHLFAFYQQELPAYVNAEAAPLERLRGLIELQLEAATRLRDYLRVMLRHYNDIVERHPHIRDWWQDLDAMLLTIIEEARTAGQLSSRVDPLIVKRTIWAVLNDIPLWYTPGRLSRQEVADQYILLLSAGSQDIEERHEKGKPE